MSSSASLWINPIIFQIGRVRQLACACAILAVSVGPASAVNQTWQLHDVTFNDGGFANGSFTFDSETDVVSNWSITVSPWTYAGATSGSSGGAVFVTSPSFTYSSTISNHDAFKYAEGDTGGYIIFRDKNQTYSTEYDGTPYAQYRHLRLAFADTLDTPGTVLINLKSTQGAECWNCAPWRELTGGSVVAVPEPETYAMFLAGLGIMGAVARHRKQREA